MPTTTGIIAALAILLGLAGWGLKHEIGKNSELSLQVKEIRETLTKQQAQVKTVTVVDTTYQEGLARAQLENESLRSSLRDQSKRLSVNAHCVPNPTPTAGSPDAEARADIDPIDADRIIAITQRGDQAIRQLTALQAYVNQVCLRL